MRGLPIISSRNNCAERKGCHNFKYNSLSITTLLYHDRETTFRVVSYGQFSGSSRTVEESDAISIYYGQRHFIMNMSKNIGT